MMSDTCSSDTSLRCILVQMECGPLRRPVTSAVQSGLVQRLQQRLDNRLDLAAPLPVQEFEPLHDIRARVRLQHGEGAVFQVLLPVLHPDPLGQRHIDVERLGRDPAALLFIGNELERAHVVQAVGKLDQQHPDVLGHREHQLAQVFGLPGARGLRFDPGTAW